MTIPTKKKKGQKDTKILKSVNSNNHQAISVEDFFKKLFSDPEIKAVYERLHDR